MATSRQWAGVIAKLQLSMGQVQCVGLRLVDQMPDPTRQYRTWWATMVSVSGDNAMIRLKSALYQVHPELVPYIKDWDKWPPELP